MDSPIKETKTYKTELIIALITAITGITVAVITNWDKIFANHGKTEKQANVQTQTNQAEKSIDFYGVDEWLDVGYWVSLKEREGWTLEGMHTFTMQPDSFYTMTVNFDRTQKFLVTARMDDTTAVIEGKGYLLGSKGTLTDPIELYDGRETKLRDLQIDLSGFGIILKKNSLHGVRCTLAIVSKE